MLKFSLRAYSLFSKPPFCYFSLVMMHGMHRFLMSAMRVRSKGRGQSTLARMEFSHTSVHKWYKWWTNSLGYHKVEQVPTLQPSSSTLRHLHMRNLNMCSQNTYSGMFMEALFIANKNQQQPKCPPIVIQSQNRLLLSSKKE